MPLTTEMVQAAPSSAESGHKTVLQLDTPQGSKVQPLTRDLFEQTRSKESAPAHRQQGSSSPRSGAFADAP
eukprot:CAMPEP_0202091544 /NCGR_PEP_ID=MMETSP0964-20121228/46315_1 /ASSEMBLY_ACC=CAM_ASM_000500 /TAXON_ID=4773 /ORGANISM="Schizochytrium aggregatum, Strain ATCC28209" /LENGTH=70 /DNA_ID=CAMNT_0048659741 /DNA_START=32 /DNA_END=240 /DNA_ORIENTATION=-